MVSFDTIIMRFDKMGEKTGWTYINIPAHIADEIKPNSKKSFRVRGRIDHVEVLGLALLPMGEGDFILALNGELRRKLGKREGAILHIELEEDVDFKISMPEDLYDCLQDDSKMYDNFCKQPKSHQNYFINWINSAKTDQTRVKRIVMIIDAMDKGMDFGQMIRYEKAKKNELLR